jgi:flagellar basal-body rod modification protein FlgD
MSPMPSIASHATTAPAGSAAAAAANSNSPLANEDTFLKLLVSQLQYQDPLNPVDSTQFVTQLTGYSQLEQLIQIDDNTKTAAPADPAIAGANSVNRKTSGI